MELYQLKAFVAVAETNSFSIASKRLCRTQSAISQQIKSLEDELGVPLFVRKLREANLTEAGSQLLLFAKSILNEADNARDHIIGMCGRVEGELNIGVGFAVEPYIRKALVEMMKLYPDVRIKVTYSHAHVLNQLLNEHKIDIAFTMNDAYDCEGIVSKPVIPIHLCAIMPKTHQLAHKAMLNADDLVNHYVIMPDAGQRVYSTIQKLIDFDLRQLRVRAVISDADAILNLVEETGMMTFLPSGYIADRPNLKAVPVECLQKEFMSKVHHMKDIYLKKSAEVFIQLIEDFAVPYFKAIEF